MSLVIVALALQLAVVNPAAPPTDWRTRPLNAGNWTWRRSPDGSEAIFSDPRGPQLVIRCSLSTRRVSFSRTGLANAVPIRIVTTSSQRQLTPGNIVLASDPLLDAIAFSRGRLWIDVAGALPLVVRAAPEPARSIEDCRS